jgi:preprotein translocase SecE subunit
MAKNKKNRKRPASSPAGVATAGDELDTTGSEGGHARLAAAGGPDDQMMMNGGERREDSGAGGLFTLYKPGQGYYTRMCTTVAGAVVALFGAHHIYSQMSSDNPAWQLGVPTVFLAICAALIFWVVGVNRRTNEFFIATEGEMKKVSWSSRKEVIGSTKVVLAFTFLMGFLLFVVDVIFMAFFSWIGVLDINVLEAIGWDVNG